MSIPPDPGLSPQASAGSSLFTMTALVQRFQGWMAEAERNGSTDPTAMSLGTVDAEGNPSVRVVLLKQADERGFVFYTNLESAKAADLAARPRAALCFHWPGIARQVRVSGRTESVSSEEADAYFASRPRLSQIGAWVSRQSRPMAGSLDLEQGCAAYALRHPFGAIARPPFWSGYRVVLDRIEFWSERPFRRHERLLYLPANGAWEEQRLYP